MNPDPQFDAFIQEAGAELEAAFQAAGTGLPAGITGEQLVRASLEEALQELQTPEAQDRLKQMSQIYRELLVEHPAGLNDAEFAAILHDRITKRLSPRAQGDR
jgi:Arc/MetJ-type ribon-helix-helix transcriptional regulator